MPYPASWKVGFLKDTAEHFGAKYVRVETNEVDTDQTVFEDPNR